MTTNYRTWKYWQQQRTIWYRDIGKRIYTPYCRRLIWLLWRNIE